MFGQSVDQHDHRNDQGKRNQNGDPKSEDPVHVMILLSVHYYRWYQHCDNDNKERPPRPDGQLRRKRGVQAPDSEDGNDRRPARFRVVEDFGF